MALFFIIARRQYRCTIVEDHEYLIPVYSPYIIISSPTFSTPNHKYPSSIYKNHYIPRPQILKTKTHPSPTTTMTDSYPCCDPGAGAAFLAEDSGLPPNHPPSARSSTHPFPDPSFASVLLASLGNSERSTTSSLSDVLLGMLPNATAEDAALLVEFFENQNQPRCKLEADSAADLEFSPDASELASDYESEVSDIEVCEDGEVFYEPLITISSPSSPAVIDLTSPTSSSIPVNGVKRRAEELKEEQDEEEGREVKRICMWEPEQYADVLRENEGSDVCWEPEDEEEAWLESDCRCGGCW